VYLAELRISDVPVPADFRGGLGRARFQRAGRGRPVLCRGQSRVLSTGRRRPHDPPRPPHRRLSGQKRANGKTNIDAIRSLKRHLVRRVYHLLHDPTAVPTTVCLTEEPSRSPLRPAIRPPRVAGVRAWIGGRGRASCVRRM
jgi:hypothetical protein